MMGPLAHFLEGSTCRKKSSPKTRVLPGSQLDSMSPRLIPVSPLQLQSHSVILDSMPRPSPVGHLLPQRKLWSIVKSQSEGPESLAKRERNRRSMHVVNAKLVLILDLSVGYGVWHLNAKAGSHRADVTSFLHGRNPLTIGGVNREDIVHYGRKMSHKTKVKR